MSNIYGTSKDDTLYGSDQGESIYGFAGNDVLYGNGGDDVLNGNGGNDYLEGAFGDDTFSGGGGDDMLVGGGGGVDTYLFGIGYGHDTINNQDRGFTGLFDPEDSILMNGTIKSTDVSVHREKDDLLLDLKNSDDSLRVLNYFSGGNADSSSVVNNVRFAGDGVVWDRDVVKKLVQVTSEKNDVVYGYSGNDVLDGKGGNDILYGLAGDDVLSGGLGNDRLFGNEGNDVLRGGLGRDTYYFALGDGRDSIDNAYGDVGNKGAKGDVVVIDGSLSRANLRVIRDVSYGDDLVLSFDQGGDQLRVEDYFVKDGTTSSTVEKIQFSDGVIWKYQDVLNEVDDIFIPGPKPSSVDPVAMTAQTDSLVSAMASFSPPAAVQSMPLSDSPSSIMPVFAVS